MSSERLRTAPKRLSIQDLANHSVTSTFADDVRNGLTSQVKTLPPKYFYDELGSQLFEAICRLPEYYLTRAESEILQHFSNDAINRISSPLNLVELGSGSATKTRYLIDAIFRRQSELHYQPIDISPSALEASANDLLDTYPGLRITAYAGEYSTALAKLRESNQSRPNNEKMLALFLGSNIGNFTPDEASLFLNDVRRIMKPGDGLLLGADLKKDRAKLIAAYDDALGVTAAFNLNLLLRINREFNATFDLSRFEHRAIYNEEHGRIEMHLISTVAQAIAIKDLQIDIQFCEGESIHTENSYKFDQHQLAVMAESAKFELFETWQDQSGQFSFNLFLAV